MDDPANVRNPARATRGGELRQLHHIATFAIHDRLCHIANRHPPNRVGACGLKEGTTMKTIKQGKPFVGSYAINAPKITQARDGTFRAIGGGYAGRVIYRSAERAARVIETDARFTGWEC
jgi:hypothetical protein